MKQTFPAAVPSFSDPPEFAGRQERVLPSLQIELTPCLLETKSGMERNHQNCGAIFIAPSRNVNKTDVNKIEF